MSVLEISLKTLKRSKKRLQEAGKIKCTTHQGRGLATNYWISDQTKQEEKLIPKAPQERKPLDKEEVKKFAQNYSRARALSWFQNQDYSLAEIEQALD